MADCFKILNKAGLDIGVDAKKLALQHGDNIEAKKKVWLEAANAQLAQLKAAEESALAEVAEQYQAHVAASTGQLKQLVAAHPKLINQILQSEFAVSDSAITETGGDIWLHPAEASYGQGEKFVNRHQKAFLAIVDKVFDGDMGKILPMFSETPSKQPSNNNNDINHGVNNDAPEKLGFESNKEGISEPVEAEAQQQKQPIIGDVTLSGNVNQSGDNGKAGKIGDFGENSSGSKSGNRSSVLSKKISESVPPRAKSFSDLITSPAFFGHLDNLLQVPENPDSFGQTANTVNSAATPSESLLDSVRGYVKALRDIIKAQAFLDKGFGGLDTKAQGLVVSNMIGLAGVNGKVFDAIVERIPVDMVDYLSAHQLTPNVLLDDAPMLKLALTKNLNEKIAFFGNASDAFIRAVTLAGAEVSTGNIISNLERPSLNVDAASGALDGNHWNDYTRNDRVEKEPSEVKISKDDIPYEKARQAYLGISFSPEKRAKSVQNEYVDYMQRMYDDVIKYAENDEDRVRINAAFDDYKAGYIQKRLAHLSAKAQVMSTMIAGPANFPVRRNERANATEHRRLEELDEWDKKALKRLHKIAKNEPEADNSLAGQLAEQQRKLETLVANQEKMKSANAAIRKGDDAALRKIGFTDEQMAKLKDPKQFGGTGFPSFTLTNNNANIKRVQERIADLEKRIGRAAEATTATKTEQGEYPFRMVQNAADNRLQLFFDGKPDEQTRTLLKSNGFLWSPRSQAWQRQLTANGIAAAEKVGKALQTKDTDTGTALYSIAPKDADFAQDVLNELAEVDELFRYAVSDKTTLAGVLQDTAPAFEYVGDETRPDEKQETGADSRLLFKTDKGKPFYIYERDGELWIDVSRLDTGDRGSAIYAAVGNYAFNTGKVFIGDPEGLSDDAVIRRTSNMLSLALRFGTTDFMMPSPEQKAGIPGIGVAPLKWQGSDVDKTKALIDTFLSTLNNQFPELKNARYDFDKRQFVTRGSGRLLDWEKFDRRAKDTGTGRTARAGEATARRGIFIQSLVSSTGGQRPGILEHVLSRANQLVTQGGLKGLFSQSQPPKSNSTAAKIQALLPNYAKKMAESGKLLVVQSAKDAPATANSFDAGGVEGYYDPKNDIVYVIADNLNSSNISGVTLHELFHRALATDRKLARSVADFEEAMQRRFNLASIGRGSAVEIAAYERVVAAKTPPEHQAEEFMAYMVSEYEKSPESFKGTLKKLFDDLIAAIKVALYRIGLPLSDLNPATLSALARQVGATTNLKETGSKSVLNGTRFSASEAEHKRQYREIESKYFNPDGTEKPGAMLAPNGEKSKLNKTQWIQVRTDNFKNFFGDWETVAKLDFIDRQDVIAKTSMDKIPRFDNTKSLVDWIENDWVSRKKSIVTRNDIGDVHLDRKSAKDSMAHGVNRYKVQSFYVLPDVLEKGVLLGSLPTEKYKPEARIVAAPIEIGGKEFKVYAEIRHDANMQRLYVHEVVMRGNDPVSALKTPADSKMEGQPQGAHHGAVYNFIRDLRNVNSSKVTDTNGEPMVLYHSRQAGNNFTEFKNGSAGMIWFAGSKKGAGMAGLGSGDMVEAYISAKDPLNTKESAIHFAKVGTKYSEEENRYISILEQTGHDSIYVEDESGVAIAVQNPNQIKSATQNTGVFDKENNDIRFSIAKDSGVSKDNTSWASKPGYEDVRPEVMATLNKIGKPPADSAFAKAKDYKEQAAIRWKEKVKQKVFDQYNSFKDILGDDRAWMMAHLSGTGSAVAETAISGGSPFLDKSGAIDINSDAKSLGEIFKPLGEEVDRFMQWVAGNRAEGLMKEGKENLFTPDDIKNLKALSEGTMGDKSRAMIYGSVLKDFNAMHDAFVKIGTDTGLISREDAAIWKEQGFYVPFYRLADEDRKTGGNGAVSGLVKQQAYKKLKGGTSNLNDLLTNTLMNWAHIVEASLKNQAATKAVNTAVDLGIATPTLAAKKGKTAVFVKENGREKWYDIDDSQDGQLVFESLSSLNYDGLNNWAMNTMAKFKRLLTQGVTMNPEFKVANLIRDSIQSIAVSDMDTNIAKNLAQGFKATREGSKTKARMAVGGGSFTQSGYIHGSDPEAIKALLKKGVQREHIIDTRGRINKMWDSMNDFGARLENVNRAAQFEQSLEKGDDLLTANFKARDQLDFTRTGSAVAVRALTKVVPFLNARLQGLSKLGRSMSDTKQRKQFYAVAGVYSLFSVALYLAMKDDDDYKNAEEWERDTYHLFKLPGSNVMYRLPRPFEIGAMANIVERATEQMVDDTVHGKLFGERLWFALTQTLAIDPMPQMAKPMIEVWANKSAFTGRAIEGQDMKRLSPTERKKAWTSQTAIGLSKGMDAILWDEVVLSPLQIEHLVQGYTSWMGATTLASIDMALEPVMDMPEKPQKRLEDYPVIGRFVREGNPRNTKFITNFYEKQIEINQKYADIQAYKSDGDIDKYNEAMAENKGELSHRKDLNKAARRMSKINRELKLVQASRAFNSEQKRLKIDALNFERAKIAREALSP